MFYNIFPKVRVWLSDAEQDLLNTIENSPDEELSKSSLNHLSQIKSNEKIKFSLINS